MGKIIIMKYLVFRTKYYCLNIFLLKKNGDDSLNLNEFFSFGLQIGEKKKK